MARPFWTSSLTKTSPPTGRDCLPVAMVLIISWRRRIHAVKMKKACRCNPHAHFSLEISADFNVVEMSHLLCLETRKPSQAQMGYNHYSYHHNVEKDGERQTLLQYTLCIIIPIHVLFNLFVTVRLLSRGKKTMQFFFSISLCVSCFLPQ